MAETHRTFAFLRYALLFLLIGFTAAAESGGVRQIDFKNFTYLWDEPDGVPSQWQWIEPLPKGKVQLVQGRRAFHELGEPASNQDPYLSLRSVTYADLDGDGIEEALVDLVYGSGGSANWHYLYIYSSQRAAPKLISLLQSGSRAYGGLINVATFEGLLVLDFADADRRMGDCCSTGLIRVSYLYQDGHFVEIEPRHKDSIRQVIYRLPQTGPRTVDVRNGNIVYRR